MNNKVRDQRNAEVIRVREEGYAARKAGQAMQSCPQEYINGINRYQWEYGWRCADDDLKDIE